MVPATPAARFVAFEFNDLYNNSSDGSNIAADVVMTPAALRAAMTVATEMFKLFAAASPMLVHENVHIRRPGTDITWE